MLQSLKNVPKARPSRKVGRKPAPWRSARPRPPSAGACSHSAQPRARRQKKVTPGQFRIRRGRSQHLVPAGKAHQHERRHGGHRLVVHVRLDLLGGAASGFEFAIHAGRDRKKVLVVVRIAHDSGRRDGLLRR